MLINNKKGITLSGWFEAIILIMLLSITMIGVMVVAKNDYGMSLSTPLINDTYINTTINTYNQTLSQSHDAISTGHPVLGLLLQLDSLWQIILAAFTLIWNFISGAWIENVLGAIFPGLAQATSGGLNVFTLLVGALRILLLMSIVFAIIRILQRVKP